MWGIDTTVWFAVLTTPDRAFSEKFVNLRFVQNFNNCFSDDNGETRILNLLIPKHKPKCFGHTDHAGHTTRVRPIFF